MKNKLQLAIIVALTGISASLVGCGGGSGGNSDSVSESGNVTVDTPDTTPGTTPGTSPDPINDVGLPVVVSMTAPTLVNAQKIEKVVVSDFSKQYAINSVDGESGSTNTIVGLQKIQESFYKNIKTSYSLNQILNESYPCMTAGDMQINGTIEASGGDITVSYNKCEESGAYMDGELAVSLSGYDEEYQNFRLNDVEFLTDFIVAYNNSTGKIHKGSTSSNEIIQFDLNSYPVKTKLNITSNIEEDGLQSGLKDVEAYIDTSGTYELYYTRGRFYIDNLTSYIDYDQSYNMSITPFVINYYGELISGQANFKMANSAKLKIVGMGGEPMSYIDADGDGSYELIEN